jgi:hypothetical protein
VAADVGRHFCAAVAIPVAFQAWRTAQDDADLEKL